MRTLEIAFLAFLSCFCVICGLNNELKTPTVLISVLARNKAHTLPYFLTLIGKLNYPKDRIALWIRSDHNFDNTLAILNTWIKSVRSQYHIVDFQYHINEIQFPDENGVSYWSKTRFYHVINLRQTALEVARKLWADYIWSLDCDTFPTDPDILTHLISKKLTVVSPLLQSTTRYSNFWGGMTQQYYYQKSDNYDSILDRKKVGCFEVPMVHSSVLVDLRKMESNFLTYMPEKIVGYDGPHDDIIAFAVSALFNGISMNICNDRHYGYMMVPLEEDHDDLSVDFEQLISVKMEALTLGKPLMVDEILQRFVPALPKKDKLGFNKIYMINLIRRPERRSRMMKCFDELGLEVEVIDAVDGKALDDDVIDGIKLLPGYADPYHKRPMTLGEIGCFLSHYKIWQEVHQKRYEKVLVLEDDIKFEPYFRTNIERILDQLNDIPGWDLVYLGRKRMEHADEPWVSDSMVRAAYSYWTLGYILSGSGAAKLLEADPLSKLLPVDEYLPIMFDKHPEESWKSNFPKRDLLALSAAPLLIFPMRYTGEDGYISDTEDSKIVPAEIDNEIIADELKK